MTRNPGIGDLLIDLEAETRIVSLFFPLYGPGSQLFSVLSPIWLTPLSPKT
jgi:hypothetical protein